MSVERDEALLQVLLDSWERNNAILVNLLRLVPEGGLEVRAGEGSPSVAQMFAHMHYVRLVFLSEDAPEFGVDMANMEEWQAEGDRVRLAAMLDESAQAVRAAVQGRIESGRAMDVHYDHPVLFLQHMIWHEGYHQGQIKLALKLAGHAISDEQAGPMTWGVWMRKR